MSEQQQLIANLNGVSVNRGALKGNALELKEIYVVRKIKQVKTKFGEGMLFDIGEFDVWVPNGVSVIYYL